MGRLTGPVNQQLLVLGNANSFTAEVLQRRCTNKRRKSVPNGKPTLLFKTMEQWRRSSVRAYVIDPPGRCECVLVMFSVKNYRSKFPSTVFRLDSTAPEYVGSDWWRPWYISSPSPPPESVLAWPIRRVSLAQAPVTPLSMQLSDRLFTSADDLAIEVPTAADKPSQQRLSLANLDGGTTANDPLASVAEITRGSSQLCPVQARRATHWLPILPLTTMKCRLLCSINEFWAKSAGDRRRRRRQYQSDEANERMVRAKVVSTGLSGGELLLEPVEPTTGSDAAPAESPFAGLKAGNWYLLAGPHPNSTSGEAPIRRPLVSSSLR